MQCAIEPSDAGAIVRSSHRVAPRDWAARPGESHLSHLSHLIPANPRLKKRVRSRRPGRSGERRKTEGGGGTQAAMPAGSPSPPSGGEGRGEEGRRAGCGLALVANVESVFCIRFLKGLKSPARSTAYSVPGVPVWQARALRPAGPSLRLKRIYRRSGGLPIVPAAVSGCSSLSAARMSAIRVFTSLSDASRGL